jgi:hypothetical protein
MISENLLINKKFYETLIGESETAHPIQILGEAYLERQKTDVPELASIRFAQGEVYFHSKDYETAVFKWENIDSELSSWANKNIADAYYELEMLSMAEEKYKSISTDDLVLRAEVALQLFSLYIEEKRFDLASKTIKDVVSFYPDYPNVSEVARAFFEEQQDWNSGIELAMSESMRTGYLHWFDVLLDYIDSGYTEDLPPDYFLPMLKSLYDADRNRFEKVVLSLWSIYRKQDTYFAWLASINSLIAEAEINQFDSWTDLSQVYQRTYLELIDGSYLIKDIQITVPQVLMNWLKLSEGQNALFAAAAVLSWSENFQGSIPDSMAHDAETVLMKSRKHPDSLRESKALFENILHWASRHELQIGEKTKWMADLLSNIQTQQILVAGTGESDKSLFVNFLSGEEITKPDSSVFTSISDSDIAQITEISPSGIIPLDELEAISLSRRQRDSVFEVKFPSEFLQSQSMGLIDTPVLNGQAGIREELLESTHAADGILFVLDASAPFTERERTILLDIKKESPYQHIHFILNRMEKIYNEQDAIRILEETTARIREYFPAASVLAWSANYQGQKQLNDLTDFLAYGFPKGNLAEERTERILYFTRKTLSDLLERRRDMENGYIDSIQWNEEMAVKLNGAINQLHDNEKEKMRILKSSYRAIKEEVKNDLTTEIPKILRKCANLLNEDSDFRRVHIDLNDAMNSKIQEFINQTVSPKFYRSLQEWISVSQEEFSQSQFYLEEMSDGFNALYGDDRIQLECDFKVLDDWRRDADRMTSGVYSDEVNILMRHTPSQLLLKGAGKLLGAIAQNKAALYTRYKKFLETMDYDDVAESIAKKYLSQFDLFEKSLDRDISLFFRYPLNVLNQAVTASHKEIKESQEALDKMRENPEVYLDPITLFEVKLRQYEWMMNAGK